MIKSTGSFNVKTQMMLAPIHSERDNHGLYRTKNCELCNRLCLKFCSAKKIAEAISVYYHNTYKEMFKLLPTDSWPIKKSKDREVTYVSSSNPNNILSQNNHHSARNKKTSTKLRNR